jgi:hypothetical protein
MMSGFSERKKTFLAQWSSKHSYFLLIGITVLCLLPFSGRAFHVDDPLFVWSGQQIAKHPLDPDGFHWFQGHWGFRYYMQAMGARPVDFLRTGMERGDLLVVPENNADACRLPKAQFIASTNLLEIKLPQPISTMRWRSGAAFYASFYGPLPFAFGASETERYYLFRLSQPLARRIAYGGWHPAKNDSKVNLK